MNHRIRSNIVSHHNLVNPDRTLSIWQFMEGVALLFGPPAKQGTSCFEMSV